MTLTQMKTRNAPGEDHLTTEMVKNGGRKELITLLNKRMEEKIPDAWRIGEVVILFKKGDRTNI